MVAPVELNPRIVPVATGRVKAGPQAIRGTPFRTVLAERLRTTGALRFSAHAVERMEQRGIAFSPQQTEQLSAALDRAAAKGARESLLLLDDAVLVASVPNRTIITAMARDEAEDSVFTKIDSAVVVSTAAVQHPKHGPDPLWEARMPQNDRSGTRR